MANSFNSKLTTAYSHSHGHHLQYTNRQYAMTNTLYSQFTNPCNHLFTHGLFKRAFENSPRVYEYSRNSAHNVHNTQPRRSPSKHSNGFPSFSKHSHREFCLHDEMNLTMAWKKKSYYKMYLTSTEITIFRVIENRRYDVIYTLQNSPDGVGSGAVKIHRRLLNTFK